MPFYKTFFSFVWSMVSKNLLIFGFFHLSPKIITINTKHNLTYFLKSKYKMWFLLFLYKYIVMTNPSMYCLHSIKNAKNGFITN